MADVSVIKKTLAAASSNNIAQSQVPVSGTPLTLNGSAVVNGIAVLDTQRRIQLTVGSEAAPRTLILSGFTDTGLPVSETLNIAATTPGTISSVYDYKQVSQALPEGAGWTSAITVGTNSTGSSPWWIPSAHLTPTEIMADIEFVTGSGGAGVASIEFTDDTLLVPMGIYGGQPATAPPPIAVQWPGLNAVNVNSYSIVNRNVSGLRLTLVGTGTNVESTLRQSGLLQG